jgi:hypothetical protein
VTPEDARAASAVLVAYRWQVKDPARIRDAEEKGFQRCLAEFAELEEQLNG